MSMWQLRLHKIEIEMCTSARWRNYIYNDIDFFGGLYIAQGCLVTERKERQIELSLHSSCQNLSRAQDLSGCASRLDHRLLVTYLRGAPNKSIEPYLPFLYSFPPRERCNLPERIRSKNPMELGKQRMRSMARPTFSYLFERGHPISIKGPLLDSRVY